MIPPRTGADRPFPRAVTPLETFLVKCYLTGNGHAAYGRAMKIQNVLHRGLRRFIAHDDASGLPPAVVERVRTIVTFLQEMEDPGELRDVPGWRVHRLAGDRRGTWSLTVTRNWRLTSRIDRTAKEIFDLDYEDYY
jgi:proteic killer suppression protein